jgi:quercetin dioxygenase-like cupin family protein
MVSIDFAVFWFGRVHKALPSGAVARPRDRRQNYPHAAPTVGLTMKAERKLEPVKDASHLYEVERRDRHAERPGFRISELQLSPTQTVPWHFHTNISDTFYVLQGKMRLFLQDPKQEVRLGVGESFVAVAGRPHLVTNAGDTSLTFLILQGVGEYDYVPLV